MAEIGRKSGDANLRKAMWSTTEQVTLFGAGTSRAGSTPAAAAFDWLASSFSQCSRFAVEIIAAGVSNNLAYTVWLRTQQPAEERTAAGMARDNGSSRSAEPGVS
jgi:hypothetical protein